MKNKMLKQICAIAMIGAVLTGAAECITFNGIRPGDANGRDGLANPERGFRFELGVGMVASDMVPWFKSHVEWPFARYQKDGVTLTQAYCYLTQYCDSDIAPEKIAALEADFAKARKLGVKFLLRFAYEIAMNHAPGPKADRILAHIRQLTPVVRRNLDVVYVLQTGWVGAWGEFHSSVHGVEKDPQAVAAIVKATLDMLPPGHFTMMRCMRYKTNVLKSLGDERELSAATAWSDAPHARIGFFNDGFLANSTDGGTFCGTPGAAPGHPEYDKVARESPWMPVEGEMFWTPCGEYERGNATNAIVNLHRHHFTSLSLVHSNSELESKKPWCIDGWKKTPITPALLQAKGVPFDPDYFTGVESRTGYEFIRDHLGYRIAAKRFECGELQPGKPLSLSLELFNYGFGTPFKERKAVFVVADAAGKVVEIETDFSCRKLLGGTGAKVEWKGMLDAALGKGPYKVGLWLPDNSESLRRRPEYAIRLASAVPVTDVDGRRINWLKQ